MDTSRNKEKMFICNLRTNNLVVWSVEWWHSVCSFANVSEKDTIDYKEKQGLNMTTNRCKTILKQKQNNLLAAALLCFFISLTIFIYYLAIWQVTSTNIHAHAHYYSADKLTPTCILFNEGVMSVCVYLGGLVLSAESYFDSLRAPSKCRTFTALSLQPFTINK